MTRRTSLWLSTSLKAIFLRSCVYLIWDARLWDLSRISLLTYSETLFSYDLLNWTLLLVIYQIICAAFQDVVFTLFKFWIDFN